MRNTHPWPWCLLLLFAGCLPTPAPPPEQAPPAPVGNRPQTQETETVDAEVGVGKSSQNLGKFDSGVQKAVASPAQALVRTKEMAAFDLQVKPTLEAYRALHGNYPKTEKEFWDTIKGVKLPELPAGHKYVYDPKEGKLKVERPKSD